MLVLIVLLLMLVALTGLLVPAVLAGLLVLVVLAGHLDPWIGRPTEPLDLHSLVLEASAPVSQMPRTVLRLALLVERTPLGVAAKAITPMFSNGLDHHIRQELPAQTRYTPPARRQAYGTAWWRELGAETHTVFANISPYS